VTSRDDVIDGRPPYWRYFFRAARDVLIEITLENVRNRLLVRADRNVPMHQVKPGLRHQDLEGINLPSFRFCLKLKKLCRVDFFVFESWQTLYPFMYTVLTTGRYLFTRDTSMSKDVAYSTLTNGLDCHIFDHVD
jgi:hypothetical protein